MTRNASHRRVHSSPTESLRSLPTQAARSCEAVQMLWTLLGVVAVIAWVVAIVDMVRRRDELARNQLVAWVLLVILLPIVGTVLYFAIGRKPAVA
jgi:DMSO reductase anchor subunit